MLNHLATEYLVRIGSWSVHARIESAADAALLDEIFKGVVHPLADAAAQVDAVLHWHASAEAAGPFFDVPPDGLMLTRPDPETWCIASQALTLRVALDAPIPHILVFNHPHPLDPLAWRVHVSVVFHKLLLLLGRLYLHAGAVAIHDTASAFIAEKWSGKSTICMWLGRAGATILSDDHIVIRQTVNGVTVSGCEALARVTAATEAVLFPAPLQIEPRDFAGVMKKEFRVGELFPALPYADVPLRRIFFPHVGTKWQLTPLSRRAALTRLLGATSKSHRFSTADDYARHLDYFSKLVRAVEAFDLELSPDLNELNRLVAFLQP